MFKNETDFSPAITNNKVLHFVQWKPNYTIVTSCGLISFRCTLRTSKYRPIMSWREVNNVWWSKILRPKMHLFNDACRHCSVVNSYFFQVTLNIKHNIVYKTTYHETGYLSDLSNTPDKWSLDGDTWTRRKGLMSGARGKQSLTSEMWPKSHLINRVLTKEGYHAVISVNNGEIKHQRGRNMIDALEKMASIEICLGISMSHQGNFAPTLSELTMSAQ